MIGHCWIYVAVVSLTLLHLRTEAEEEEGLVNLSLKINKLNLTRHFEDGRMKMKNPFFFNLDIPSIFSMNLDTKRKEGTSLGLRVLNPINRFLSIFGIDNKKKTTEEGWALSRRASKGEETEKLDEETEKSDLKTEKSDQKTESKPKSTRKEDREDP